MNFKKWSFIIPTLILTYSTKIFGKNDEPVCQDVLIKLNDSGLFRCAENGLTTIDFHRSQEDIFRADGVVYSCSSEGGLKNLALIPGHFDLCSTRALSTIPSKTVSVLYADVCHKNVGVNKDKDSTRDHYFSQKKLNLDLVCASATAFAKGFGPALSGQALSEESSKAYQFLLAHRDQLGSIDVEVVPQ